jgi:MtfA peptidase
MVLSWSAIEDALVEPFAGHNVVIHEVAHMLDLQNGGTANGMPPLHKGMSWRTWTDSFSGAFADLSYRAERHWPTPIDVYGATSPAEFFAVASESYFSTPEVLRNAYPDVYAQLDQFYSATPRGQLTA